jgi:hypothetical protein
VTGYYYLSLQLLRPAQALPAHETHLARLLNGKLEIQYLEKNQMLPKKT